MLGRIVSKTAPSVQLPLSTILFRQVEVLSQVFYEVIAITLYRCSASNVRGCVSGPGVTTIYI